MKQPRFLLVRFSAIGDCVMAAWAATAIRQKYPDAFLCWAVESRCAAVVETEHLVDMRAEFPRDIWKRHRWSPAVWREQLLAFSRLRPLRFDYGIDLQGHSKTALCLRIAAPKRAVAAKATDQFSQTLNHVVGERPDDLHTVEWNMRVLEAFGDFPFPTRPIMSSRGQAQSVVLKHIQGKRPLATIAVSAGHPDKTYPLEYWREVARGLLGAGYEVAYLGGPSDASMDQPRTVDLVGRLSLEETLEAVAMSNLHLAADTGTGHMAAAFGVPVISIFGPTDPAVFRPYTSLGRVLREGVRADSVLPQRVLEAARDVTRRANASVSR